MSEKISVETERPLEVTAAMPAQLSLGERLKRLASMKVGLAEPTIILTLTLSMMGSWSFLGWFSDIPSHFRMHYAVIQLFCLLMVLVRRKPQWVLLALLGLGMNVAELSPAFIQAPPDPFAAEEKVIGRFRLMQMNVQTKNRQYGRAMAVIREMTPDIISLNEVDSRWLKGLQPVLKDYPHHVEMPHDGDNFGIALYSRIPFVKSRIHWFDVGGVPTAMAAVSYNKQVVTILSIHPPPPTRGMYEHRNRELRAIIESRVKLGQHLVVAGDFNTTPYSQMFKDFTDMTGLRDSRDGFGYQSTWPAGLHSFGIPIDHILVSEYITVKKREVGPEIGSDHLPVVAELELHEPSMSPMSVPEAQLGE